MTYRLRHRDSKTEVSSNNCLLFYFKVELLLEIEESLPQWILRRVQVDKYEEVSEQEIQASDEGKNITRNILRSTL